jgi:T4-like virus tail tube protein gp19
VLGYNVYRCWISEFQALPELDGSGNAVAIQTLDLENEGWERDTSVTEPTRRASAILPRDLVASLPTSAEKRGCGLLRLSRSAPAPDGAGPIASVCSQLPGCVSSTY